MTENEAKVLTSGIYGKAEVRFGGKIAIGVGTMPGSEKTWHAIDFSEFYDAHQVGESSPKDVKKHESQVLFLFDDIRSLDVLERALATVRENMKRELESETNN